MFKSKFQNQSKQNSDGKTPKGLNNLGNTCFFNSILQCLGQTKLFTDLLNDVLKCQFNATLSRLIEKNKNVNNHVQDTVDLVILKDFDFPISTTYVELMFDLCSKATNQASISPYHLRMAFVKKCPRFMGFEQHDSHDALRCLLDGIRQEELRRWQKAILTALNFDAKQELEGCKKHDICSWGRATALATTVDRLFGGIMLSSLTCLNCDSVDQIFQVFFDMSLAILDLDGDQHNLTTKKENDKPKSKREKKKETRLAKQQKRKQNKGKRCPSKQACSNENEVKEPSKGKNKQTVKSNCDVADGESSSGDVGEGDQFFDVIEDVNFFAEVEEVAPRDQDDGTATTHADDEDDDDDDDDEGDSTEVNNSEERGASEHEIDEKTADEHTFDLISRESDGEDTRKKGEEKNEELGDENEAKRRKEAEKTPNSNTNKEDEVTQNEGYNGKYQSTDDGTGEQETDQFEVTVKMEQMQNAKNESSDENLMTGLVKHEDDDVSKKYLTDKSHNGILKKKQKIETDYKYNHKNGKKFNEKDDFVPWENMTKVILKEEGDKEAYSEKGTTATSSEAIVNGQLNRVGDRNSELTTKGVVYPDEVSEDVKKKEVVVRVEKGSSSIDSQGSGDNAIANEQDGISNMSDASANEINNLSDKLATCHLASYDEAEDIDQANAQWLSLQALVPPPPIWGTDLERCLARFTSSELLTGPNQVICSTCTKRSGRSTPCDTIKRDLIIRPPATLVLQLKRFQQVGYRLEKCSKKISFPIHLDMSPFCSRLSKPFSNHGKVLYRLSGLVEHSGSLRGGHYVSYITWKPTVSSNPPEDCHPSNQRFVSPRNIPETWPMTLPHFVKQIKKHIEKSRSECKPYPSDLEAANPMEDNRKWYCCNDSYVFPVSLNQLLHAEAYLLFYERIA